MILEKKPKILWIMCGIPGSGKSTWLREHDYNYVSRDEVRFSMLEGHDTYFAKEDDVFKEFARRLNAALTETNEVYADATHLSWFGRKKLINAIQVEGVQFGVIVFQTPLDECIRRNNLRTGRAQVPTPIIINMDKSKTNPYNDPFNYYDIKYIGGE